MNRSRLSAVFGEDYIKIAKDEGTKKEKEIVYWLQKEWEEEPGIVFSIVNAVKLAYTNPNALETIVRVKPTKT